VSRKGANYLIEFLATKTTAALAPKLNCEPGSAIHDKLSYGTQIFYLNTIKMLLLLAIALTLGILPYVLVFVAAYVALRITSFGIHLSNSMLCTLVGLVYYLGSAYIALNINISLAVKIVLLILSVICFVAYAPAETKKCPIPAHQRKILRTKTLRTLAIVICIVFALHYHFPVYSSLVFLAVVCQAVNLLPITYKIFGER